MCMYTEEEESCVCMCTEEESCVCMCTEEEESCVCMCIEVEESCVCMCTEEEESCVCMCTEEEESCVCMIVGKEISNSAPDTPLPQAITLPPLAKWPSQSGFSFSTWIRIEMTIEFQREYYKPVLYWFVTVDQPCTIL